MIIGHAAEDAAFRDHRTPAMHGFQSYISMPIVLPDAAFSAHRAPSIRAHALAAVISP